MSDQTNWQQQVELTLQLLFQAAQGYKGRVLDRDAVRHVCSFVQNTSKQIEALQVAMLGADQLLVAYTEKYGSELLDELTADSLVVDGIVEEEEE